MAVPFLMMHILSGIFPPGLWICMEHTGLQCLHSSEGTEVYFISYHGINWPWTEHLFKPRAEIILWVARPGWAYWLTNTKDHESIWVTVTEYTNLGNLKNVRASFSQLCKLEWSGKIMQTGEGCSLLLEWFLVAISSCVQGKEGWTGWTPAPRPFNKGA